MATHEKEKPDVKASATPPTFTKGQLVKAKAMADHRDILTVVLDENKTYTMDEAKKLVSSFLKGKVK